MLDIPVVTVNEHSPYQVKINLTQISQKAQIYFLTIISRLLLNKNWEEIRNELLQNKDIEYRLL